MIRFVAGCLIAGAAGWAAAAPAPKPPPVPGLYFAARKGDTWVYEWTTGAQKEEVTEVVTRVEPRDQGNVVSVSRWTDGRFETPSRTLVSADGLARLGEGGPFRLLKLPAKPGERWEAESPARKSKFMFLGEEEIEVPAGKFKALQVEAVSDVGNGQTVRATLWYAKGVGLVKKVAKSHQSIHTVVLKSFTPAKD